MYYSDGGRKQVHKDGLQVRGKESLNSRIVKGCPDSDPDNRSGVR